MFRVLGAIKSLAEFSVASGSLADVVSEDDVCRAFCIPPNYTENFDQTQIFFNKFKYFRSSFMCKTTQRYARSFNLVFFSNLCHLVCLKKKSKRMSVYIVKELPALRYY